MMAMNLLRRISSKKLVKVLNVFPSQNQIRCLQCARLLSASTTYDTPGNRPGVVWIPEALPTWEKMKWEMGFRGHCRVSANELANSAYNLYVCCTDLVDFTQFVEKAGVPDTFNAWFFTLQLHMWMVYVRLSQMGKEGYLLRWNLYTIMWDDVEKRLKAFGKDLNAIQRSKTLKDYYSVMMFAILYLDEAILGDDKVLANALWVHYYALMGEEKEKNTSPTELALMVEYVRKQVYHLDKQDDELLMHPGYVSFLPLVGDKLDMEQRNADLKTIKELPRGKFNKKRM